MHRNSFGQLFVHVLLVQGYVFSRKAGTATGLPVSPLATCIGEASKIAATVASLEDQFAIACGTKNALSRAAPKVCSHVPRHV